MDPTHSDPVQALKSENDELRRRLLKVEGLLRAARGAAPRSANERAAPEDLVPMANDPHRPIPPPLAEPPLSENTLRRFRLAAMNLMEDALEARDRALEARASLEREVADRRLAEQALRDSEERFRTVVETAPEAIFILTQGRFLYLNSAAVALFGATSTEQLLGKPLKNQLHRDYHGLLCHVLARPGEEHHTVPLTAAKLLRYDGTTVDVEISATPFAHQGKKCALVFARDVTERKAAEEVLHRYELLAGHSRDIILFMRRDDGRILEANAAATGAYGYSREELLGLSIHDLRAPETQGDTPYDMAKADAVGGLFETAHRRKNGSVFPVEVSSQGATVADTRTLVSVIRDVTERKQAETALRESLEEKIALLKEVHHRVKNNLQIVASLLSLQANHSKSQQVIEVLEDTRNRVHSMALLHEVLYRSESLARINFAAYVSELCQQLLRSYGPVAARIQVEQHIAPIGLPLELSVPCGLIINELLSNALKHAFPNQRHGKVEIQLQPAEDHRLVLCVRDDGVGLAFDFNPARSSSLGLKLVSNLAMQLRGHFEWDRTIASGSAFRVDFPVPDSVQIKDGL